MAEKALPELRLGGLRGNNPLGFLAAVGLLEVLSRRHPRAALSWSLGLVPAAMFHGVEEGAIIDSVLQDAAETLTSAVLNWPPENPVADAKVAPSQLRAWAGDVATQPDWVSDLWSGLLSDGALDNNGTSKPTHLHFTAGQQKFLDMVRQLGGSVDEDRLREAVFGPWRYDSTLPSLSLDIRGERIYALRGRDPSKETRTGVPAADWLAFRGFAMYPTRRHDSGRLETTACDAAWKRSAFRWPLWSSALRRDVVKSLVADPSLVDATTNPGKPTRSDRRRRPARATTDAPWVLRERGVLRVYQSRISRSDQGGYGSFSPPETLVEA